MGVCNQNQCQRQPINEGQTCSAPNICITGETCNNVFCVGMYTINCCPSPVVAGTPQPHAAIAIAVGPAGNPAVSTWRLAVTTLLVLSAGTIVIRRTKRGTQGAR